MNSRPNNEEQISDLEDRIKEFPPPPSEQQTESQMKRNGSNIIIIILWYNIKCANPHIMGVLEEGEIGIKMYLRKSWLGISQI